MAPDRFAAFLVVASISGMQGPLFNLGAQHPSVLIEGWLGARFQNTASKNMRVEFTNLVEDPTCTEQEDRVHEGFNHLDGLHCKKRDRATKNTTTDDAVSWRPMPKMDPDRCRQFNQRSMAWLKGMGLMAVSNPVLYPVAERR